jgi:hypothetical protein
MKYVLAIVLSASFLLAPQARAGEAGEALSKCLSDATTPDDRRALVRWIFSAIAAHPDLREFTTIDAARHDQIESESVAVFERLIVKDCTAQTRLALMQEGTEGFQAAFKTLGELAMGGVVEDAQVQASMARLGERIDEQRILQALLTQ